MGYGGIRPSFEISKNNKKLYPGIQFQVKSLTFGLKRIDKKAKSFELLEKASVKMLEGDSLSKIEEGEIEKINEEEKLKR
jgi:hypothetical protein